MVLKKFVPALVLSIAMAGVAMAQSPSRISQFNAWGAYSYNAPNGKVCYILSLPTRKEPSNVNHGDIFFLISQRPGQNISYEPQAMMGYPLKEQSKVNVNIDGKNYVLFTKGDSAWVENAAEEPALVAAMRAGSTMTVRATSRRGTDTTYTFSLSGVTAALNEIQNCQ
ncbi:invasion associated locus B family protein [Hoeflea sp.]|uniref:invasion associated locus B family protein n=1 Tax=Hoeflea sp. TaxID=1940281 RepID=UPI003B016F0D